MVVSVGCVVRRDRGYSFLTRGIRGMDRSGSRCAIHDAGIRGCRVWDYQMAGDEAMIIKDGIITYSWFEVHMTRYLTGCNGTFSRTTEPLHENKSLWMAIQDMKKLARSETPEMAGE